jgi:amino acid adenylation domain-containing protein
MIGALAGLTASRALRQSWLRRLGGHDEVASIPTDYRENRRQIGIAELEIPFSDACQRRLAPARAADPSPVESLLATAIILALQARLSGTIVIGVPPLSGKAGVAGDVLPILVPFEPDQTLEATWQATYRALMGAYARANAGSRGSLKQMLAAETQIPRVDLLLAFDDRRAAANEGGWPLEVRVSWQGERHSARLLYRTDLFARSTAADLSRDIGVALHRLLRFPLVRVRDNEFAAFEAALLGEPLSLDSRGIFERFSDVARQRPDACALVYQDEKVTYRQFSDRVDLFACGLASRGLDEGATVALHLRPGLDLITCVIAAHRIGAVYVVLPVDYPALRLNEIVADTRAALVVTDSPGSVPDTWQAVVSSELARPQQGHLAPASKSQGRFSVFYTSSSTGRAKGVVLLESALLNRLSWMWKHFPFAADDKILLQKSPAVVGALWELYGGLLAGVCTVIADPQDITDPDRFAAFVRKHQITRIAGSPPILENLLIGDGAGNGMKSSLRIVYSSADALTPQLVQQWHQKFPRTQLLNLYGSTECSSNATWFDSVDLHPDQDRVPIGKPIANVRLYILNQDLAVVPLGGIGELCVSGACLADGYLDRDSSSQDKFIDNPFAATDGRHRILYRTGDRARMNGHGHVELLGRMDHMIKLRGFRIALGDVEFALKAHPKIRDAIALVTESSVRRRVLHAFYCADEPLGRGVLRAYLSARIPRLMIPSAFSRLDRFPMTKSGKVDRRALSAVIAHPAAMPNMDFRSQQGLEQLIRLLWQEYSGADDVELDDRIMDVGIDSLAIVDIRGQLQRMTGCKLELSDFFQFPTPRTLAARILNGVDEGASVASARSRAAMRRVARNGERGLHG